MNTDDTTCQGSQRLRMLRGSKSAYGIDSVHFRRTEHDAELLVVLTSYWNEEVIQNPNCKPIDVGNIVIEGGRRIRDVEPVLVHHFVNDETLGNIGTFRIRLNHAGDPSDYRLKLIYSADLPDDPPEGFDHRYVEADFRFCTSGIVEEDCAQDPCLPEENLPHPPIDYVAKDYASFRRLMLDRLAQTVPNWTERCPADLGITLVEALAYHADHLSYFQDAVATEAYLQTARRRLSVRRHARFVDYQLHEGCNARAWVFVKVNSAIRLDPNWAFYTSPETPFRHRANSPIRTKDDLHKPSEFDRIVFEPIVTSESKHESTDYLMLRPELNRLTIYTWGNGECCLPQGATSATLSLGGLKEEPRNSMGEEDTFLKAGDLLMFEEVIGPNTGIAADANPAHRHTVRLTRVVKSYDVLPGSEIKIPILIVSWDTQDALPFSLCISAGDYQNVTIARGNIVLVDHGLTTKKHELTIPADPVEMSVIDHCQCQAPQLPSASGVVSRRRFKSIPLALYDRALTQVAPFPNAKIQARSQARQLARWLAEASAGKALMRFLQVATGVKHEELERQIQEIFVRIRSLLSRAEAGDAVAADDHDLREVRVQLEGFRRQAKQFDEENAEDSKKKKLSEGWSWRFDLNLIGPARADLDPDPRLAAAAFHLSELSSSSAEAEAPVPWTSVRHLMQSGPEDRQFVMEFDDGEENGTYNLRFGDGTHGMAPWPGSNFSCSFREGNGSAGNVGIDAINSVVGPHGRPPEIDEVQNFFPARGGVDPEPTSEARFKAPQHFRTELVRAVTADDYARLATLDERVNRAIADMCWTGTCYEVNVALDLFAFALQNADNPIQEEAIIRHEVNVLLQRYRSIGHEVQVVPTRYVPLQLELDICVKPHARQGNVPRLVREALSNRTLSGGRMGYFHPDRLTFGQSIDASSIVAEVQRLTDVDAVRLVELRRLFGPQRVGTLGGTLTILPQEIARLDNDKSFPENGRLVLNIRGGR